MLRSHLTLFPFQLLFEYLMIQYIYMYTQVHVHSIMSSLWYQVPFWIPQISVEHAAGHAICNHVVGFTSLLHRSRPNALCHN